MALVLSRKVGERIIVDSGRLVIEVVAITSGNRVRLGLTAPLDCPIEREELLTDRDDNLSEPVARRMQACS